jgi:hypothetical protein
MKPNLSGAVVTIAGLLLAGGGVYAMSTGWDMVQLERGWSLFISGSVMLSGGVVTLALGRVIAHLAGLGAAQPASAVAPARAETAEAPAPRPKAEAVPPKAAPAPAALDPKPAPLSQILKSLREPPPEAPKEVDRYEAGGSTYIMMSDGSVEVHGPDGRHRYPSLAALRAEAGLPMP